MCKIVRVVVEQCLARPSFFGQRKRLARKNVMPSNRTTGPVWSRSFRSVRERLVQSRRKMPLLFPRVLFRNDGVDDVQTIFIPPRDFPGDVRWPAIVWPDGVHATYTGTLQKRFCSFECVQVQCTAQCTGIQHISFPSSESFQIGYDCYCCFGFFLSVTLFSAQHDFGYRALVSRDTGKRKIKINNS